MPTLDMIVANLNYRPVLATENELGHHLADLMGGRSGAVYDRNEFRRWDPSAPGWVLIGDEEVARAAAAYEGKTYRVPEHPNTEQTIRLSAAKVKGIVKQAAVELARPGFFNDAVSGAAFRNCFARVDGDQVAFENHSPDHRTYAEHVRSYPLVPSSLISMPVMVKFLTEAWAGCADIRERVAFMFEYLGAAMLMITWLFKDNPLIVGPKDGGKSVLLNALRACFPPGTAASVSLQAMGMQFGLSPLIGATVNIVTELPEKRSEATEKAKALLVGDAVEVEKKYKTPFPFRCTIGHLFAGNALPPIVDPALRDRFVVIDFPNAVHVDRQDPMLTDKLLSEVPMIASMAIHAAADGVVRRARFVRPPSSKVLARGWEKESDNVASWATAAIMPGSDEDFVRTADLYFAYTQWCVRSGEQSVKIPEFGRRLTRAGFRSRNRQARGYLVKLLSPAEATAASLWNA